MYTVEGLGPQHPEGLRNKAATAGEAITYAERMPQLGIIKIVVRDSHGREIGMNELLAAKADEDAQVRAKLRGQNA